MRYATIAMVLALSACTQYWVRPATTSQQAAADLAECRKGAGSMAVMQQVEPPCMTGKGYYLSNTPAAQ